MSKILPNLYLGEATDANNKRLLDELEITHILIVARELPEFQCQGYQYLKIPASDNYTFNLKQHFNEMNEFIEKGRKTGNVLVHCMYGVSRSATAVIAFVISHRRIPFKRAFDFVACKRRIQPNEHFIQQLIEYALEIKTTEKSKIKLTEELNAKSKSSSPGRPSFLVALKEPTSSVIKKILNSPIGRKPLPRQIKVSMVTEKSLEKTLLKNDCSKIFEKSLEKLMNRSKSKKNNSLQNQLFNQKISDVKMVRIDLYAKQKDKNTNAGKDTRVNPVQIFQRNHSNSQQLWKSKTNTEQNDWSVCPNVYKNFMPENEKKKVYLFKCSGCETRLFSSTDLMSHSKNLLKENEKCVFFFLKNITFFTGKKDSFQVSEIKCPKCEIVLGDYRNGGMVCSCGIYVQFSNRIIKKNIKMEGS